MLLEPIDRMIVSAMSESTSVLSMTPWEWGGPQG